MIYKYLLEYYIFTFAIFFKLKSYSINHNISINQIYFNISMNFQIVNNLFICNSRLADQLIISTTILFS